MKWFGKKKQEEVVDPLTRVYAAIDEANAAINALPIGLKRLRLWTRAANRTRGEKPKLMLGFWDGANDCFVVTYGDD